MAGRKDESVELAGGKTVGDLTEEVARLHPPLREILRTSRFSVNLELVGGEKPLHESDVVGVLPPVAGG